MPELTLYWLTFPGGLHIGTRGVDLEEAGVSLPSDTLFSALVDAWSRSGGEVESFLEPFLPNKFDPPFLLTSAFPFVGQLRFYPMLVKPELLVSARAAESRVDDLHEIRYLSEGLLRLVLNGQQLNEYLFVEDERATPESGLTLQHGEFWLLRDEALLLAPAFTSKNWSDQDLRALRYRQMWASDRLPRVTINRVDQYSTIFHAGRTSFASGCGLWFGVQWRRPEAQAGTEDTFQKAFSRCMEILSDDGLGGERSTGYGAFRFETGELTALAEPQAGKPVFLLSRFSPGKDVAALTHPDAAYRLVSVAGWAKPQGAAALRRRRLFLVAEGSLVIPSQLPAGEVVNVAPGFLKPRKIYRSGLALTAGWSAKEV